MMLAEWASQFVRDASPVQVRNLDTTIDFSDVRDVVGAYRLVMQLGRAGEIYNVGSGTPITTGELFFYLRTVADPNRPFVELSPGARFDPIARIDHLVRDTGWKPTIGWQETVADTLAWWRERQAR